MSIERLIIEAENHHLVDNTNKVVATTLDDHQRHIAEHQALLSVSEVRKDQDKVRRVLDHIQAHNDILKSVDQDVLNIAPALRDVVDSIINREKALMDFDRYPAPAPGYAWKWSQQKGAWEVVKVEEEAKKEETKKDEKQETCPWDLHEYVEYIGFTDRYYHCSRCGKKRDY